MIQHNNIFECVLLFIVITIRSVTIENYLVTKDNNSEPNGHYGISL